MQHSGSWPPVPGVSLLRSRGPQHHYVICGNIDQSAGPGTVVVFATEFVQDANSIRPQERVRAPLVGTPPTSVTGVARWLGQAEADCCSVVLDMQAAVATVVAARMGLPPLYVCRDRSDLLVVTDDLRLLLAARRQLGLRILLNRQYFGHFLTGVAENGFASRLWRTPYANVDMVPPGHALQVDPPTTRPIRYWRYWEGEPISETEAVGATLSALRVAVRRRQLSDHTGVALSGGLDSSCVVGALAPLSRTPIPCYVNFSAESVAADERPYARAMVDHVQGRLRLLASDALWALQGVAEADHPPQIDPFQGWFSAQDRAMANSARDEGVRVILDGIGGDELFGVPLRNRYVSELADQRENVLDDFAVASVLRRRWPFGLAQWHPTVGVGDIVPSFLNAELSSATGLADELRDVGRDIQATGVDPVTQYRLFSFSYGGSTLSDCLWLRREVFDHVGIRRRHPFLDHNLVECVFRCPTRVLVSAIYWKPLLRRIAGHLVPEAVSRRKLKGDYSALYFKGLLERESSLLSELMIDPIVCQVSWVDAGAVRRCFDAYLSDPTGYSLERPQVHVQLWLLICLELWLAQGLRSGRFSV